MTERPILLAAMPTSDQRPVPPAGQAVSLVVIQCPHRSHADGRLGRKLARTSRGCDGTLIEIPPTWLAKVRQLVSRAAATGWGILVQCPNCRAWSEVLVIGRKVA